MYIKKIMSLSLALMIMICIFSGCGSMGDEDKLNDVELADIYHSVKEAYGENYIPDMAYDQTQIEEVIGLKPEQYEDVIAETSAIMVHTDTLVAVKAKEGGGEEVEAQLNTYRDKFVNDAMQYPINQIKIEASRVVSYGDYVFFLLVGATSPNDMEDQAELLNYFKDQVEIGVKAIEAKLGITK